MAPADLQGEDVPNYLRGGVIYRREISGTDSAGGLLEFAVDPGGAVILQTSWKDDPLPAVADEITSRERTAGPGLVVAGSVFLVGR